MEQITLEDLSLNDCRPTKRVSHLRDIYFKAVPEICVERPYLVTRFHLENGFFGKDRISVLDKARAYRYVLANRKAIVIHDRARDKNMVPFSFKESPLFAGSTTSKFKGVPLYPEFLALTLWPELWTISKRRSNPYFITEEEVNKLNFEVFPHWMESNILELARKRCFEENRQKHKKKKYAPEMKLMERVVFFLASKPECISHTIPDFSRAVNEGLRKMIDDALAKGEQASDEASKEFYWAISEVLEGVVAYSKRLGAAAEALAEKESDPFFRQELLDIAEINRRVPEFPARSFREGLTTVWICWTAIHLENPNVGLSLGRLDQLLYELYRRDIDNGTMDNKDAVELVCCMWLKIGDHVPTMPDAGEQLFGGTGSNQAITIGGVDEKGADAVNDLTYVMLRATELMKLRDPNLNARYFPGVNTQAYLKRLCETNVSTGATPAIHNDRAIIKALMNKGETPEQARDYGIIGCVEPGSNGRFYGHSASILFNLTSVLELTLYNGRHRHTGRDLLISQETGDAGTFGSFADFKKAFEAQARWLIDQSTTLNNIFGRIHQDFYPTPMLSAFFEGPVEKGKDLIYGGATINSSGVAIIGLADVADSLSAIETVVFKDREVTFDGLLDALDKDFEGYEPLRTRLINPEKTPKYGNEDPVADANARWVVELLDKAFGEKTNYRGSLYRVGYWTMTNHAGFARFIKALPNGRRAGDNFASGITPVSGVTPYLSKALNSVASLPAPCLSSGVALNLKFTQDDGNPEKMLERFVGSVEGYFDDKGGTRDGGVEIQFNIIDRNKLIEATEHPEAYSDLLVRVSGYTAYFKDLNPQMQKEIIERTEYRLSTGEMLFYGPFQLPK
jgi:formate C-acetyltransferase